MWVTVYNCGRRSLVIKVYAAVAFRTGGGGAGLRVGAGEGAIGVGNDIAFVYSSSSDVEGDSESEEFSDSKGLARDCALSGSMGGGKSERGMMPWGQSRKEAVSTYSM